MSKEFVSSGDVLKKIFKTITPPEECFVNIIEDKWLEIVGENIAKITKIDRFENRVLYVSVKDPIWRQELYSGLGKEILQRVRSEISHKVNRITWF